ncbi:hypothetical protein DSO57_1030796 [Entomophthora muscae]|uniref:Uncharacterized protein n=1 Tax=Entomophthora muscae TaxID=34485 RepID=A0ACC2RRV1_9FUNG|nr:hypothetical protein DSO57_1030796 [Entomophthora muscae]
MSLDLMGVDVIPPYHNLPLVPEYTLKHIPWLLTGMLLMGLDAYVPVCSYLVLMATRLSGHPVLHCMASWWFTPPGWELSLLSLAPLSHRCAKIADPDMSLDNLEKIEEGPAIVQTFNYLVSIQTTQAKYCYHGISLGSERGTV